MASKSIITIGFESVRVDVECSITNGLPAMIIVGLASKAVDEAKERLRSAIQASGFTFPRKRIVINLAPAELPKDSASLDLAIALAILSADKQVQTDIGNYYFIGELGLDGDIRAARGVLAKLRLAEITTASKIIIPEGNRQQAELIQRGTIYASDTLSNLVKALNGNHALRPVLPRTASKEDKVLPITDFSEISGQDTAKRALLIAAAGEHNILLSGPPGTGKSMLAKAFVGILPSLEPEESIEATHIHSLSSMNFENVITSPPLRSPHHTASDVAITGGGHTLRPGEISLAHHGVLFLDELPEFKRTVIESLRQPLEDREITVARAQYSAKFPASFILVATSNPCPCGYLYSDKPCTCTASQVQKYQKKLSGPILDRIDLHVTVNNIAHGQLLEKDKAAESPIIRKKVTAARAAQKTRQNNLYNGRLGNKQLKKVLFLEPDAEILLNTAAKQLELSARSYIRTLKVARTIADLDQSVHISREHIAEALQYRPKSIIL